MVSSVGARRQSAVVAVQRRNLILHNFERWTAAAMLAVTIVPHRALRQILSV